MTRYYLFTGNGQFIELNAGTMKSAINEARNIRKAKGLPSDIRTCRALIHRVK